MNGSGGAVKLRLYVAGAGDHSLRAIAAVRACADALGLGDCTEVIDAYQAIERAREDGVIVLPTAVWCGADGSRRIVGDLSDPERFLDAVCSARRRGSATNRSSNHGEHAPERSSQY